MDKEVIKHFDKIFGTDILKKINFEDKKLLKAVYRTFEEDITKPNPKYKDIRQKSVGIAEKLEKSLTEEQKELLNEYQELENEMHSIEFEQVFIFGYLMSKQIDIEGKIIDEQD